MKSTDVLKFAEAKIIEYNKRRDEEYQQFLLIKSEFESKWYNKLLRIKYVIDEDDDLWHFNTYSRWIDEMRYLADVAEYNIKRSIDDMDVGKWSKVFYKWFSDLEEREQYSVTVADGKVY